MKKFWSNLLGGSNESVSTDVSARHAKVESAAKDFAIRFEDVMKELSKG